MARLLSATQIAHNVDIQLNVRGLSLAGPDHIKLLRLRHAVKGEMCKEVDENGEVKYKKGFQLFAKLPIELRRMIWNLAIPDFRHRILKLYGIPDPDRDGVCGDEPWSITCPPHPAMSLMLACKEARDCMYELYFVKHDRTTVFSYTWKHPAERDHRFSSFSEAVPEILANQKIDFDNDILYIPGGFDDIRHLERDSLPALGRFKIVMVTGDFWFGFFDDADNHEIQDACLESLSGVEQIIIHEDELPDLPHSELVKRGYSRSPPGPYGSTDYDMSEPVSFMPFDEEAVNEYYTTDLAEHAARLMQPPGYRGLEALSRARVYYSNGMYKSDGTDCRLGPILPNRNPWEKDDE